jgi:hypothetical protein
MIESSFGAILDFIKVKTTSAYFGSQTSKHSGTMKLSKTTLNIRTLTIRSQHNDTQHKI